MASINLENTRQLIDVIERGYKPTTTLVDTFFSKEQTFVSEFVDIEYRKGGRKLAPYVVPGTKGINIAREGSEIKSYKAPLMRPKRVIEAADVIKRGFGETVYSVRTPQERAEEMRANDLAELVDMCTRRQEYMAAQLLVNGSYEISGYADDGSVTKVDTINFGFENKAELTGTDAWSDTSADIYGAIEAASLTIRQATNMIPTVAIMSPNVVPYILNNEEIYKYLLVPSRDNLALLSIQPRLVRPDLMRVGFIQALNLELYSYASVYEAEDGTVTQYIPDNTFILAVPNLGRRLYGAVTQMEPDGNLMTYASAYVPKVTVDVENDVSSLAVSSRCVVAPDWADTWYTYTVAEAEAEEETTEDTTE